MILTHLLVEAWDYLDGRLASQGAPPLSSMSARRALNLAYYMAIRNMDTEDRDEFESKLGLSMVEWLAQHEAEKQQEREERLTLAATLGGEVG